MKHAHFLLASALLGFWQSAALADTTLSGAYEEARKMIKPSVRQPPPPPARQTTTPRPTPKVHKPTYGYNPSVAVGAALFGSLLQEVLFAPAPSGPDPETLRRQEEARQRAEAEALRRAAEEQARHERAMTSLKSLLLPRNFSATPGEQTTTGSGLKALESLDTATEVSGPLDGNLEKLRAEASAGWDTPDTRFAIRWQPMPLSAVTAPSVVRPLCQGGRCAWPQDTGSSLPRLDSRPARHHPLDQAAVVRLLRRPDAATGDARSALVAGLMAGAPDTPGVAGRYLLDRRLLDFAGAAGKELLWVITAQILDASGPLGKGITLTHDVYELAKTDMEDAIKVAGWLGSASSAPPPSITSPEEAALPFLNRALGESKLFGETAAEYAAAGVDASQLANRLLALWRESR